MPDFSLLDAVPGARQAYDTVTRFAATFTSGGETLRQQYRDLSALFDAQAKAGADMNTLLQIDGWRVQNLQLQQRWAPLWDSWNAVKQALASVGLWSTD